MVQTYILKHKDIDTAVMTLDTETCELYGLSVLSEKDIPVLGPEGYRRLSEWIDSRAIPGGRKDLEDILENAGCQTAGEYLIKNLALGLTDTYWLCPEEIPNLTWDQVNLFTHAGQLLTFHDGTGRAYYSTSSDAALTGSLPKQAVHRADGWYMRKEDGGLSGEGLQNINEAFASLVHSRQGFRQYTPYSLIFDEHKVCKYCECKYFTDERHELISAYDVTGGFSAGKYSGRDALELFTERCCENGLEKKYVNDFLDYQLLSDFLITNTDRHWGNFGILRDPDTLRFLSMAPIYDSGSSMFYNNPYVRSRISALRIETSGIEKLQQDQLKLVHDPMLLDLEKVPTKQETFEFYARCGVAKDHARQIADAYGFKVDMLCELQHGFTVSIGNEYEYGTEPPYAHGKENAGYSGRKV